MTKSFLFCFLLLIAILQNEAGKKRARTEMGEKFALDDNDLSGKIGHFCPREKPFENRRKRAPEWHSSDNDTTAFNSRGFQSGDVALNKLVAAFLSDPECEGKNVFLANQSVQGNVATTKLDMNALINSDCIAVERHNMFYGLSGIPSIGTPWRNYCTSIAMNQPANQHRKKLLKAIKSWMGNNGMANIPDICLQYAAKLRSRLEMARDRGAQSGAASTSSGQSSSSGTYAPAPFQGPKPCIDNADCDQKRYLCFENDYEASMGEICPIACRYCRPGETYYYEYKQYYMSLGCKNKINGCNISQCGYYTEDYKAKNCALTCQRCSSFLRWRY